MNIYPLFEQPGRQSEASAIRRAHQEGPTFNSSGGIIGVDRPRHPSGTPGGKQIDRHQRPENQAYPGGCPQGFQHLPRVIDYWVHVGSLIRLPYQTTGPFLVHRAGGMLGLSNRCVLPPRLCSSDS